MELVIAEKTQSAASETSAVLQMIERAARDPSVDIDKMMRLMKMRDDAVAQAARVAYARSLASLQAELPTVERNGRIIIKEKGTERVIQSTKYALWEDTNEAIKPVLKAHGFSLSFRHTREADRVMVTAILLHEDGHSENTTVPLALDSTGSKNNVQAVGSSLSYGKRYAAGLLLNLTSRGEDDDGAAAGRPDTVSQDQVEQLLELIEGKNADKAKFLKFYKIEKLADMPVDKFQSAMKLLVAKGG
jgi:hypothetical protein